MKSHDLHADALNEFHLRDWHSAQKILGSHATTPLPTPLVQPAWDQLRSSISLSISNALFAAMYISLAQLFTK
jgi:hypothetical protein